MQQLIITREKMQILRRKQLKKNATIEVRCGWLTNETNTNARDVVNRFHYYYSYIL